MNIKVFTYALLLILATSLRKIIMLSMCIYKLGTHSLVNRYLALIIVMVGRQRKATHVHKRGNREIVSDET